MFDELIVPITALVLLVILAAAFMWADIRAHNGLQKKHRHSKHRPF